MYCAVQMDERLGTFDKSKLWSTQHPFLALDLMMTPVKIIIGVCSSFQDEPYLGTFVYVERGA